MRRAYRSRHPYVADAKNVRVTVGIADVRGGGSRGPAGPGLQYHQPSHASPQSPSTEPSQGPNPRRFPEHHGALSFRLSLEETAVYDYMIVGAGSARCVLAARLSADSGVSVLLLEAGLADDADEIRAPAAVNRLFQTAYDWNYQTVPQHRAGGRAVYWPRGKVLGGSSSINAMIYIRGNRHDFQGWKDEHGCVGWGYEDLMPYFRRAEDNSRGAGPYHGTGGPLASPIRGTSPRPARRSSRPPRSRAQKPTTTSTGRARTASAGTRSPRGTASAARPPPRTCTPRCPGRTSPSTPMPWSRR